MNIKPILFSTEMVQAIIEGKKTQTRRIVKPNPEGPAAIYPGISFCKAHVNEYAQLRYTWEYKSPSGEVYGDGSGYCNHCPYGMIGDILWVRETFVKACQWNGDGEMLSLKYYYRADNNWSNMDWYDEKSDSTTSSPKWKPSLFMPKVVCRLFLKITDIRVERLQDISEQDAISEGAIPMHLDDFGNTFKTYKRGFQSLWESINGADSWQSNPFVWVISFTKTEKPKKWPGR